MLPRNVDNYHSTQSYVQRDLDLHQQRCKNLSLSQWNVIHALIHYIFNTVSHMVTACNMLLALTKFCVISTV